MIFDFDAFLIELIHDVPLYVYEILISLACVCIIIFFAKYDWKKALHLSFKLLFWEYLFLTYSNTVFFRPRNPYIWHNFTPFWSYKAFSSGNDPTLLPEIIMNIVGFFPLGLLMKAAYRNLKWWQIILVGFLVSLSIESIQYFSKLGIAEFDDVFNNTLGVAIGYTLYAIAYFFLNKLRLNTT